MVGSVISFELEPRDGATMAERAARVIERTPWLVCEHAGAVAGYAYAGPHRERAAYRWSADVSVYVHAAALAAASAAGLPMLRLA